MCHTGALSEQKPTVYAVCNQEVWHLNALSNHRDAALWTEPKCENGFPKDWQSLTIAASLAHIEAATCSSAR